MSTDVMEQKLVELQRRVEKLEAVESRVRDDGDWRDVIGFAEGDDLFREAMDLGAQLREQANREGR
jgi:hypothetical protein